MLLQLVNVLYVLVAIAMIALILMQQGSGAQAGSGFGGGASATVFGSRGSSNFLTKSTKWLGVAFFAISLGMAYYASKAANQGNVPAATDLGVMAQSKSSAPVPKVPTAQVPPAPAIQPPAAAPAQSATAPAVEVPAAPAPAPAK